MSRLAIVCAVLVLGQFTPSLTAEEPKQDARVLLAFEKTRFKSTLVDVMKKQLEQAGIRVSVVEHSKKGLDADAAEFEAVFITNSGAHSKVRPWIVAWLDANKAHKTKILLHTTQTRDWNVQADVDAVTSASSNADVDKLATLYVQWLQGILGK